MHRNSIAHRDLKPENILLRSEATKDQREVEYTKLADLGVSLMGEHPVGPLDGSGGDQYVGVDTLKRLAGGMASAAASEAAAINSNPSLPKPWHVTQKTEGTPHFYAPECCTG